MESASTITRTNPISRVFCINLISISSLIITTAITFGYIESRLCKTENHINCKNAEYNQLLSLYITPLIINSASFIITAVFTIHRLFRQTHYETRNSRDMNRVVCDVTGYVGAIIGVIGTFKIGNFLFTKMTAG